MTDETESMFDLPPEELAHVTQMLDGMIADMEARTDEFLQEVDTARDALNAVAGNMTAAEVERRDLTTALGQMSAEYALVPLKFMKVNREALLRNGPDLIFLIRDIVVGGQEAVARAVEEYQENVQQALDSKDAEDKS